jgi:hypothetical protein
MGARYYDPALGRFITQDTWEGRTWEPWTKNLYAYGRGNPVTFIDPAGHAAVLPNDTPVGSDTDVQLLQCKMDWEKAFRTGDEEAMRKAHERAVWLRGHSTDWTVGEAEGLDYFRVDNVLTGLVLGIITPAEALFHLKDLLGEPEIFSVGGSVGAGLGIGFQVDRTLDDDPSYYHTNQIILDTFGGSVNVDWGWTFFTEDRADLLGRATGWNVTYGPVNFGYLDLGANSAGQNMVLVYLGFNLPIDTEGTIGRVWSSTILPPTTSGVWRRPLIP